MDAKSNFSPTSDDQDRDAVTQGESIFNATTGEFEPKAGIKRKNPIPPKMQHPVWVIEKIEHGSRSFCQNAYNERRKYLLNLTDIEALSLPIADWYDRNRFEREMAAAEYLNRCKAGNGNDKADATDKDGFHKKNWGKKEYKHWMAD